MSLVADNKSAVTQTLLDQLQSKSTKVAFMPDAEIISAIRYLEDKGIPNNKHEDYKYCNMDAVFKKEFKNIDQEFNEISNSDVQPYKLNEAINLVVANGTWLLPSLPCTCAFSVCQILPSTEASTVNSRGPAETKGLGTLGTRL